MQKPKIIQFGEKGLLLNWPEKIDDAIHDAVLAYQRWIESEFKELIQETNIGYQSLLILLKNATEVSKLKLSLENAIFTGELQSDQTSYIFTIPVCYDISLGLDLVSLATQKKLSPDEIISLHSNQIYKVYFSGFLPGFLYLGGLNPVLHSPRLSIPRLEIPKGSVAIGGEQTGIYPKNSPGGWHIIGRTPIQLFDPNSKIPTFCEPGDWIQFEAVSLSEFENIESQIQAGEYKIRKEDVHD